MSQAPRLKGVPRANPGLPPTGPGSDEGVREATSKGNPLLSAALAYAQKGWLVFPIYEPNTRGCSCGNLECKHIGMHPRTAHGWRDASTDPVVIEEWWRKWPEANVGIAMGGPERLAALDVDGPAGEASLEELVREHGKLPATLESLTGTGRHILMTVPEGVKIRPSVGALGEKIDIRPRGTYIVAPPSLHVTGRRYRWASDQPISPMPEWLLRLLTVPAPPQPARNSGGAAGIPEGKRNPTLTCIAGGLRRQGLPESEIAETLLGINSRQCVPSLSDAEVRRIAASVANYAPGAAQYAPERLAKLKCFAQIQPKSLRWVWRNRIPAAKLSLLVGDPDKGKSLITLDITARITTGTPFPDGAPSERGSVIILSAEDDSEDTIRPRLDAAGADASRVHWLEAVRVMLRDGKHAERGFSLDSDIDALYDAIKQTPDVRLIVIDPISAYLGTVESHRNAEVRRLLSPLAGFTARTGVAVLGVTHFRKSSGPAIHRSIDSIAFAAAARAVWGVAEDTDDPAMRVMVRVKGNLCHDPGGLAYRIEVALDIPRIAWEPGAVNLRADDVLGGLDSRADRSERRAAEAWLKDFLADGPKAKSQVERQSKQAGLAPATVRRAAVALRIKKQKPGFDSGWEWSLPEDAQCEDAHPIHSNVSTFGATIEKKGNTSQYSHETPSGVSIFDKGAENKRDTAQAGTKMLKSESVSTFETGMERKEGQKQESEIRRGREWEV